MLDTPDESPSDAAPTVENRIEASQSIAALADELAANLRDGWEYGTAADAREFAPHCIDLLIRIDADTELPAIHRTRAREAARRLIDALDRRFPLGGLAAEGRRWG